ncbi:TMEM175 family protein [Robiginitalea sp. IMCC44478]|uniref:TMEM175 family protein n=1 Tax=Robiginitalea sp. IMCC44478 TaxID=3459122 RepID=UPI0040413AC7
MKFPHNSNRLEAFSDGVFAFAATLMVVSLDLNQSFMTLSTKGSSLITIGVSFFVLAALWVVHYNYFKRSGYVDNWIITFNTVLLFVILYYVFPMKSLIRTWMGQEEINMQGLADLFQWYSLGFMLIFLCYALMYYRAYRKTRSLSNSIVLYFYARHFSIYVFVGLISIALSTLKIGITYGLPGFIYVLLRPFCYAHSQWFEKKFKTPEL